MILPEHSKIINTIAKKKFKSLGIKQKGQSRIWLDDRGWFTTIIEFQPFRGSQGTTLNIGVNFHWYKKEYFSFDIGYRQNVPFIEYNQNDDKFSQEVEKFCEMAITKILEYREFLKDIYTAKSLILNHIFTSEEFWGNYHKGTICGLTNDFDKLNKYYQKLLKETYPVEWVNELKREVERLRSKIQSQEQFTEEIIGTIKRTRTLKKLPEIEIRLTDE